MNIFVPSQYSHSKGNPSTSWDLASGTYLGPGGWVYNYNAVKKTVKIVVAPTGHSGVGTTYSRGDSVYDAIVKELLKEGEPLSASQVKALKSSSGGVVSSAIGKVKEAFTPTSAPPVLEDEPFHKQPWFPPVAIFGTITLIGLVAILATGGSEKKAGKVIPFRERRAA